MSTITFETLGSGKIPFHYVATPEFLYDDETIDVSIGAKGLYATIARFLQLGAQEQIGDRKVIKGWSIPVAHETLAKRCKCSRDTIIRYVKQLVGANLIETKRGYRGRYEYRLVAYADAIEQLKHPKNPSNSEHHQSKSKQSKPKTKRVKDRNFSQSPTVGNSDSRETQNQTHDNPNKNVGDAVSEMVRDLKSYIKNEVSTLAQKVGIINDSTVSNGITPDCRDLRHIKDKSREIKDKTLSSSVKGNTMDDNDRKNDERVSINNWKDYEKYAVAWYGQIHSKKFLKEVCLFFKEKVSEYGFSQDKTDITMQMITKLKSIGRIHHVSFDQEYGLQAYKAVLDDEERKFIKSSGHDNIFDAIMSQSEDGTEDGTIDDDVSDSNHITKGSNFDYEHLKKRAPKPVKYLIAMIETRQTLVKNDLAKPYSDNEIEQSLSRYYKRNGDPKTAQEWLSDRMLLREMMVIKGLRENFTDGEIERLTNQSQCLRF